LFDLLSRGSLENNELKKGDIVVFASVGAGMNINSMVYRIA
jgi:3-oxoacyl-[acyl-carrier-protein] synthase-3